MVHPKYNENIQIGKIQADPTNIVHFETFFTIP